MTMWSRPTVGVDWLVAGAKADAPLAERLAWLEHVARWVRSRLGSAEADAGGASASPAVRLRFLLRVLDRNEERQREVARLLRGIFAELDATSLLCEAGLPRSHAFFQELFARLAAKVLPEPPPRADLATVFVRVFPSERDAVWVASLPDDVLDGLARLLRQGGGAEPDPLPSLRREAGDAILVLASEVQAIGLSGRVRGRGRDERLQASPFASLAGRVESFIASEPPDAGGMLAHLARCRAALADTMAHLERYGVSTDLVYTLERARLSLSRIERLLPLVHTRTLAPRAAARFVATLIEASAIQRSVGRLLQLNGRMLARRVVESARRTGEHYLTHDAIEYRAMLASAAIGGAVTGITVLVKLAGVGHGLPLFVDGLVASLNYALSFVAIHLLHGTLATKQPAMTAATMAAKLNAARHRGRLRDFVEAVADLVRTQIAAIVGNLLLVVPSALALHGLLRWTTGTSLPAAENALHYVESLSLLGATPLYAAYTGVLLWLSALCAGWFENWAAYRRLPEAIATSPAVTGWLGERRAARFAQAIEGNIAALGGNVSLGFLLGMTPAVAAFFGLPLEVRHVTLSTGQLAVAAAAYGSAIFREGAFWLAVAGIGVIGVVNLTVSFALAMAVAIRSTDASAPSRRRLLRATIGRLLRRPADFVLPPQRGRAAR